MQAGLFAVGRANPVHGVGDDAAKLGLLDVVGVAEREVKQLRTARDAPPRDGRGALDGSGGMKLVFFRRFESDVWF